ncbi:MAG: hypothetical protein Kow00108_10280 [Calditrichia bacterium]
MSLLGTVDVHEKSYPDLDLPGQPILFLRKSQQKLNSPDLKNKYESATVRLSNKTSDEGKYAIYSFSSKIRPQFHLSGMNGLFKNCIFSSPVIH